MKLKRINTKKAFKESDLEAGIVYGMSGQLSPLMIYEGKIDDKHSFMHEFGVHTYGPILSWRDKELRFTGKGRIILSENSNFKIYLTDSKEYNDKIEIIRRIIG